MAASRKSFFGTNRAVVLYCDVFAECNLEREKVQLRATRPITQQQHHSALHSAHSRRAERASERGGLEGLKAVILDLADEKIVRV